MYTFCDICASVAPYWSSPYPDWGVLRSGIHVADVAGYGRTLASRAYTQPPAARQTAILALRCVF